MPYRIHGVNEGGCRVDHTLDLVRNPLAPIDRIAEQLGAGSRQGNASV
ncbi:MAG: hypothetical protein AAF734_09715 [Bacteroidota bacterium]